MKIYLTGGWGYGNKGDNAIFEAMMESMRNAYPGCTFEVSSFDVAETQKHHGLTALPSVHVYLTKKAPLGLLRWAALAIWHVTGFEFVLPPSIKRHLNAMRNCDAVVLGGGGYINDDWVDMLTSRFVEIQMATSLGKPVVIYGQTLGPIGKSWTKPLFKHFIHKVTRIAYRDEQSRKVLDAADYPAARMTLTADEVNLVSIKDLRQPMPTDVLNVGVMVQKLRPHLGPSGPSPRGRIATPEQYVKEISDALLNVADNHTVHYHFIPSTGWDEPVCRKVYERIKEKCAATFYPDPHISDFMSVCQHVDLMVSTNMHPIILASTNGKPSVALSYHYKLDDYMASIQQGDSLVKIDDFDSRSLAALVSNTITTRKPPELASVKDMARRNIELLTQALRR
ncbi:hypothetical protein GTZ97_16265 [Aquabacterium fontiphilum]|uniref:polysaccharide pyruvyl transferase family protein n=1 Tax=Aquabacterium fontiphilum TaxID=450365 RepID=UPI001378FAE9|nr:polysaccharide pyruvyl transferase family protein [Aquabacterium fontiphilum]NBD22215.1 hypothetical protein [Aquabacterium fontiphilum]